MGYGPRRPYPIVHLSADHVAGGRHRLAGSLSEVAVSLTWPSRAPPVSRAGVDGHRRRARRSRRRPGRWAARRSSPCRRPRPKPVDVGVQVGADVLRVLPPRRGRPAGVEQRERAGRRRPCRPGCRRPGSSLHAALLRARRRPGSGSPPCRTATPLRSRLRSSDVEVQPVGLVDVLVLAAGVGAGVEQRVGQLAVVADRDRHLGCRRAGRSRSCRCPAGWRRPPTRTGPGPAFLVLASSTPESGVKESVPIRSTTSTV